MMLGLNRSLSESSPYTELNFEKNEIRLVQLSKSSFRHKVKATLCHVSLKDAPAYDALSYTWGKSTSRRQLLVNEKHWLPVTDNLYDALQRLVDRPEPRPLFVDAICIDQSNLEERSHLVSLMGEIYSQASRVLVWVGDHPKATPSDQKDLEGPHNKPGTTHLTKQGLDFLHALDATLRKSKPKWHDRLWIIQEFVLARELWLCFGYVCIPLELGHIWFLRRKDTSAKDVAPFFRKVIDLFDLRERVQNRLQGLEDISHRTFAAECSDPRDYVYGLHHLLNEDERAIIRVDYQKTVAQVFSEATYASIRTARSLSPLELIRLSRKESSLPSWTIEFAWRQNYNPNGGIHEIIEVPPSGLWQHQNYQHDDFARLGHDHTSLIIRGTRFGEVLDVVQLATRHRDDFHPMIDKLTSILSAAAQHFDVAEIDTASFIQDFWSGKQRCEDCVPNYNDENFQAEVIVAMFGLWDSLARPAKFVENPDTVTSNASADAVQQYMKYYATPRALFMTTNGFLGLAQTNIEPADSILLLERSKFTMLVRKADDGYTFQGFVWIHGVMQGELLGIMQEEYARDEFVLK